MGKARRNMEDNRYPELIEAVMRGTIAGGLRAGAQAAEDEDLDWSPGEAFRRHAEHVALLKETPLELRPTPATVGERVNATASVRREVLVRDAWQCAWCRAPTIDGEVLLAVAEAFPHRIPYYKNRPAHPVIQSRWPAIDHRYPHPRTDDDSRPCRLVVACWLCNAVKSDHSLDQLGWAPRERPVAASWKGLTDLLNNFRQRVIADLLAPDAPRYRLAQEVAERVVRVRPAVSAAIAGASPAVRAGVERLEALAEQYDLSVVDEGKSRRIGADLKKPMLWLYPVGDPPRVEVELRLVPAGRLRESIADTLAAVDPRGERSKAYPRVLLADVAVRWNEVRPALVSYLKAAWP
jgi:hypothetical protein